MSSPAPYASMLYGHLVDLQAEVASSWRGQGTNDAHATIANIEARIAELEAESGTGLAWTPVDEVRWRGASRGVSVVLEPGTFSWLAGALDLAGIEMPSGFRGTP